MKLVVFSIVKNEAKTIGEVLDRVPNQIPGVSDIQKIILSDGSTDETEDVAKKHGALTYRNRTQKRLAHSFREIVKILLELDADIAVGIDGDLQLDPAEIPNLVKPIVEDKADFVAGDRFTDPETGTIRRPGNMPIGKYLGNRLGAAVINYMTGQKYIDVTCGFRAYNKKALIALNTNSGYTYTQESFQVLAMKKIDIVTIPVTVKYFPGRKSRVVQSLAQFITSSAIAIIRVFRDFSPMKFFIILGAISFIPGILMGAFVIVFWLINGTFTPYKFLGFTGIYATSLGLITWIIGLVADMLSRVLSNQEKILEIVKENKLEIRKLNERKSKES